MSEPIRKVLSDRVSLVYGFADGHLDVEIKLAFLPSPVRMQMEEAEVPQAIHILIEAATWNARQREKRNV